MTAGNQRLVLALVAVAAIAGAALLALSALKGEAAFFYGPSDGSRQDLPLGRAVRLGGIVIAGSMSRASDGVTVRFVVTGGASTTPVTFADVVSDLFRKRSGVVAEGQSHAEGSSTASNLPAMHDMRTLEP